MKGKVIAAVAAAVCIVPIAYTLTSGERLSPQNEPDRPLLLGNAVVPDDTAVSVSASDSEATAVATSVDHATAEGAVMLSADTTLDIVADGSRTSGEEQAASATPMASYTETNAPLDEQPASVQTYPRVLRSASVLSPGRSSSGQVGDSPVSAELVTHDSETSTPEVGDGIITDVIESQATNPANDTAQAPSTDYVPIVSTLSPALDHVLPTEEIVAPAPTSVPLPATVALLGIGLLASGLMRFSSARRK